MNYFKNTENKSEKLLDNQQATHDNDGKVKQGVMFDEMFTFVFQRGDVRVSVKQRR